MATQPPQAHDGGHDGGHAGGDIRVGCSGWSYQDWKDIVYQGRPAKEWFAHYATMFGTVEVNNTFYRLAPPETFDHWRAQAPPGFVYAVKMHRYGTHRRRLREPETWLPNQLERVVRLGPSLGPQLVQLPPRWKADPQRLEDFCLQARQSEAEALTAWHPETGAEGPTGPGKLRWAVEVRDASWLNDTVFAILGKHDFALCVHDLLAKFPWERTARWAYVRFHGPHALTAKYSGEYGPKGLQGPASRLAQWADEGADVYAYFNNDIGGAAVRDATWLSQRLVR